MNSDNLKYIYCDVDGTLLMWPTTPGSPKPGETPTINQPLVDALRAWQAKSGGRLVIWSRTGQAHAEMAGKLIGLDALCLAKPDLMIDDADPFMLKKKLLVVKPGQFA